MRKISFIFIFVFMYLLAVNMADAKVKTKVIEYKDGNTVLEGYLAWDTKFKGKRPGIVVVHEWWGLNDYPKMRARKLAKLGYVAFAVDIYGKGKRAATMEEASHLSSIYSKDLPLLRHRVEIGLNELKKQKNVDKENIAAIGYCFGGTTVLELARSGADLQGVASFHGGLLTSMPAKEGKVKAKIIAFHGADDPYVTGDQVIAFKDEMRKANANWQIIEYGNARHSFTVKAAGTDQTKPLVYNEQADKRSWRELQNFLKEIFK